MEERKDVQRATMVVNLYGGPGAGKTTAAWELAAELKKQGVVTEYVPEYAKELVWDDRLDLLDGSAEHQRAILREQKRRLERLRGKVDIIVTDSPVLLLGILPKKPGSGPGKGSAGGTYKHAEPQHLCHAGRKI